MGKKALRDDEVVDTPTHILLAGTSAIAPPAICPFESGIEMAEGVNKSGVKQPGHARSLLISKSRIAAVGPGIGEVDFPVVF